MVKYMDDGEVRDYMKKLMEQAEKQAKTKPPAKKQAKSSRQK